MIELVSGARTDVGQRRSRNEDAIIAGPQVFAVADGMGGHARGDVAARLTVEALAAIPPDGATRTEILDAIRRADEAVVAASRELEQSMGTTVCGIAVLRTTAQTDQLLTFNVGDSRAYRLRGGVLEQLTHDHSVVQELLDDHQIDVEEVERHPDRHVVTRSLGADQPLDIDWWPLEAIVGDRFLVCSDGLTKEVPGTVIETVLAQGDPQIAADALVDAALAAGGRDNASVVVVDVVAVHDEPTADEIEGDTNPRPVDAADSDTAPTAVDGPNPVAAATVATSGLIQRGDVP